jgi:uncharacterized RDD family membrane protein YckC
MSSVTPEHTAEQAPPPGRSDDKQAWARWIARSIDALLLLPLSYGVWYVIGVYWNSGIDLGWLGADSLDWALSATWTMRIADAAMFILLLLVIEPFFIGIAGATPGKWLMGIRIVRADGRNLGYFGSLARSMLVVSLGLALYIPVASFVAMILQLMRVSNGQLAAWDEILDCRVVHKERPALLWLILIVSMFGTRAWLNWDEWSARLAQ